MTARNALNPLRQHALPQYDAAYLAIHIPDMLHCIETGDPSWEAMVPTTVADIIKSTQLFGHQAIGKGP
jgi:hypothetical protein